MFYPQTKVERSKAYQLQDERIGNPVPLHVNQGRVTFSRGIKRIGQTIVEPLNKAPKDMTVVSDACRGTSPVASNSEVTRGSSEASTLSCFYLECTKHFLQIVLSFLMVKQKEIQSYRIFQCILLFPHSTSSSAENTKDFQNL